MKKILLFSIIFVLQSLQLRTLTIAVRSLQPAVRSLQLRTILLLIVVSTSLQAQQWHYHNPTFWYDVNTVEILGPGIIAIGGGNETNDSTQIMFQTSDYGETWYENAHDGLAPWNKSIAFSDSINGYGVGYDGRIIKTDDAGMNWGWPVTPTNNDLNKIIYVGAGTYYAAGGNKTNDSIQTILKSTDYGNTWSVIFDAFGPWLKSIYFIDTLKGFAVGDNGVILATTNGGGTWVSITAPIQRDFNAITFVNADTGYIVGGTPSGLCRRTILQTVNGGTSWSVLKDTTGGILKDISFADSLVGYTVGDSATVLKTTDGGFNWLPITIDTNLTGNETFNAVKFYNQDFGVIGGKAGLLYIYQNTGVDVFTLGSEQVGLNYATLLGAINTHTKKAKYSFVYSKNIMLTPSSTQSINVRNDSLLLISEFIQGLTPNITYYYCLMAMSNTDTVYSDTLRFYTGVNSLYAFQTLDATNISAGYAKLNGYINKFSEPVNLFFEIGTSPAFNSIIAAIPTSVNDTLSHYINANITGLDPNRKYFFRLKGVTNSGLYYGDTKTFFPTTLPCVNTQNASNIASFSAQLNGNVFYNGFPATIKFEYGLTPLYDTEVNIVPDSLSDSLFVNYSYSLTGLSQMTIYHFRLQATNALGTAFGDDMTFKTESAMNVLTIPATEINLSSATLNGAVDAGGIPTSIKFEYGPDTLYGSVIDAVPDLVSDTGNTNIYALLSGLIPNSTYHFRIKATNSDTTKFSNDMMFYTGQPEIPNFDFELWDSAIVDFPDEWTKTSGIVSKYSPGTDGNYAVKIQNTPDGIFNSRGYVEMGFYDNVIVGGAPFNERPDSLLASFNYDIETNDTAMIGLVFKKDGNIIANNFYFIYGNSEGSFIDIKFPIQYQTSDFPDTIWLAFTCSDMRNKASHPINSYLIVDNIRFTGTSLTIPNNSFEQWHFEQKMDLLNWKYDGYSLVPPDTIGTSSVSKVTDAFSNNFAVKLKAYVFPNEIADGSLTSGIYNSTNKIPVNAAHQSLTGYYKYFPQNNDTMSIYIEMYKNGATIGNGYFLQKDTVSSFTPFIANINYFTLTEFPDSASIIIKVNFNSSRGNSSLYIDNLNFDGFLSGVKESPLIASGNFDFNIFPNPFSEQATVSFTLNHDENVIVRLFDLSGKQVALLANDKYSVGIHNLNLSAQGLQKGFYICIINTEKAVYCKKLIIN